MSDTNIVQQVREKIDDAIDAVEKAVADRLAKVPTIVRPALEMSANGAFAVIRGILGIPDDIGGDAD